MRRSIPTALGLVALGGLAAALAGRPAGDPVARCSLELPGGSSVALRYVPRPYDAEQLRELRREMAE